MTKAENTLPLDDDLRDDALGALHDVPYWRLTPRRWRAVAEAVDGLAAAVRDGDPVAVRVRTERLAACGPVRATGIDEEPTVPAPDTIRPVLNTLVRALAEDEVEEPGPPEGAG